MFHWYRRVGAGHRWAGARAARVVAAVIPAALERAVVNAVLFRTPAELEAAYDEVATAYARSARTGPCGCSLRAAKPRPRCSQNAATSSTPTRRRWARRSPSRLAAAGDALEDWTADGDLADVVKVNDRSYTFGTDSWGRALDGLALDHVHIYVERRGGEPVACLMIVDSDGHSEVQMVAVVPEARGAGLAGKLLAHGLADAAERGSQSVTLIATKLGYPVYRRLGFEDVGVFEMWERRAE